MTAKDEFLRNDHVCDACLEHVTEFPLGTPDAPAAFVPVEMIEKKEMEH